MKNFRTFELALAFYKKCQKIEVKNRHIRDQFERASLSIVLNIAEGSGRLTEADKRRFYSIALGSLNETKCLLQIMERDALLPDCLTASYLIFGSSKSLNPSPNKLNDNTITNIQSPGIVTSQGSDSI